MINNVPYMHFCVSSISESWFLWRYCYIRNVLLFPIHFIMCTRHSISERLRTYSWFQPGSVKFILFCKYSCIRFKAFCYNKNSLFIIIFPPRYDTVEIGHGNSPAMATNRYVTLSGSVDSTFVLMIEDSVGWIRFRSDYANTTEGFSLFVEQMSGKATQANLQFCRTACMQCVCFCCCSFLLRNFIESVLKDGDHTQDNGSHWQG